MSRVIHSDKIDEKSLDRLIKTYRRDWSKRSDAWIEFTLKQTSINSAIAVAALCINKSRKRHPHQYRLKQKTLDATCAELLALKSRIKVCKSFDELYQILQSLDIFGLGPLTRYDIATRIGAYLKLFPDRVYLHAGTKTGATVLLGKISKPYLFKSDLPKPFRSKEIQYWEIEDMLCILKDHFKSVKDRSFQLKTRC